MIYDLFGINLCPGFDDPDFDFCETCSYVDDCSRLKYGTSSYPGV